MCKLLKKKHEKKQEERKSEEETIFIYACIHLKNLLKEIIVHHFFTYKGFKRTGHSVCHVVTQKIKLRNFFPLVLHKDLTLLTEVAIASSSEVQNFKHRSSNHIA